MTTTAPALEAETPGIGRTPAPDTGRRPSIARLTRVELRKMVDTRSGFWLALSTAALTAGMVVLIVLAGKARDHHLTDFTDGVVQPAATLLPIVGVLLVASEWSQRTTLSTFALVPRRGRVVVAKLLASVIVAVIAYAIALPLSMLGTAIASHPDSGTWSFSTALAIQTLVYLVASVLIGTAFGAALLSPAPGIVLYFVLPIGWAILTHSIHALEDAGRWLDTSRTMADITSHDFSGKEWARLGVSLLPWMVAPLAFGAWRIRRSEIS
jgi:ABC-type transport system involved in multi-copper enzyme maturation permease subunit